MNVLMISTDRNIFKERSEAQARMVQYGALADELHIIVFATRESRERSSRRMTAQHAGFAQTQIASNVRAYPTNSQSRWRYVFDAARIGKKLVAPTLVTAQDPFECGLAGWLVARHFKAPLQLQVHTDFLSPYFSGESFVNKIRVRMAHFLIPRAARIRVVSERIKKLLVSRFKIHISKIDVLPIFVDVEKIKSAPIKMDLHKKYPQFDFIALMASRFSREKNIPLAISAMGEVMKKHPRTGLIIVGDGPERKNLQLRSSVVFEPWTDDLMSYYKTADVFLLSSNYEGYGRTAVEALAAGVPVVMTDAGIAGEVVKDGENGLVTPVGDARAFADAILRIREKRVTLKARMPLSFSKEDYLKRHKDSWEQCGVF